MADKGLDLIGLRAILETQDFERGMRVYQDGIDEMEAKTDRAAKETAKATEDMARKQEQSLQRVGLAFAAAGAAGTALLTSIAMTASRTEELGVILDVTATNARRMAEANGDFAKAAALTADAVQSQVDAVKELGITTQVASQLVAQMIRYDLDWTRATELAALAQDAATFAAQDSSEALEGLIHGITTLNPRVLRTYGILVNLEQEYQKFADANDRVSTELTATEKQAIALNAALAQGPNIAGAYEAAMDTASKQIRSLKRDTTEVAEAFGQFLTPALNSAVGALRDVLKWMRDLPDPVQETAVQLGVAASGFSSLAGALILVYPKVKAMIIAFQKLSLVQSLASAGMLGPLGLVAGLTAASVALALYARNLEDARREEAAGIADAAESYEEYIALLGDAELGSYALSESLWEIANSADAAANGIDNLALTEAFRELEEAWGPVRTGIDVLDDLLAAMDQGGYNAEWWLKHMERIKPTLTDAQKVILTDAEAVRKLGEIMGYSGDELERFTQDTLDATRGIAFILQEQRDAAEMQAQYNKELERGEVDLRAIRMSADEFTRAMLEQKLALEGNVGLLEKYDDLAGAAIEDAAERMVEAEDNAAEARQRAHEDLIKGKEDLERDHAKTVASILQDLADVDIDLNADLLQAEQDYQRSRSDLATQYLQDITDAEVELARDQEKIRRDTLRKLEDLERDFQQERADLATEYQDDLLEVDEELARDQEKIKQNTLRKLEDLQREYNQDLEDAQRELADDLAKIEEGYQEDRAKAAEDNTEELQELEQDLADANAATWQRYYDRMESLAEKHNQTLASITEKYAKQRAAIEDKYRTAPTRQEAIDTERERLLAELEKTGRVGGYMERQRQAEILAQLEALKEDELAVLLEAQQEELDAEEAAYQELQAQAAQQREDELAANQVHYEDLVEQQRLAYETELNELQQANEEKRSERQTEYEKELEDLVRAREREREEIYRDQEQRLSDLQAAHQLERQEIAKRYQERLDELAKSRERERAEIQRDQQRRLSDLQAAHEVEKQEIARRYQERQAELAAQLEEEKRRLEEAAQEAQERLRDQLADESQNYRERRQELRNHYDEQKKEIEGSLAEEQEKIKQGLADELREITDRMGDQSRAFRDAYGEQLRDLEAYLWERLQRERQYQWELQNLWGIHSPSKWMIDFGKSLSEGMEIGIGPSVATSLGGALGSFQSSLGSLASAAIQPAAMPVPMAQPSVSSSESYNIDFQAHYARQQSESSLRDDVALIQMQLKSAPRGRR